MPQNEGNVFHFVLNSFFFIFLFLTVKIERVDLEPFLGIPHFNNPVSSPGLSTAYPEKSKPRV